MFAGAAFVLTFGLKQHESTSIHVFRKEQADDMF
jgi:hypothetical protein